MMLRMIRRRKTTALKITSVLIFCIFIYCNYLAPNRNKSKHSAPNETCASDFQVIVKNSAFAYSAYIDNRPTRNSTSDGDPVVRVFVYYERAFEPQKTWRCMVWHRNRDDPVVTKIKDVIILNPSPATKPIRMTVAMIVCSLPGTTEDLNPHAVSLVPKSVDSPSNYICIIDLRPRQGDFLKETNNQSSISSYPSYTICTKPVHDDYYKVHDIVNFIEVNRLFGAEKFIFYADAKTAKLSNIRCLESYSKLGIVELRPFTPPVLESLRCHGQMITNTECMYRAMYRTKFVINIDLDELTVPVKDDNWNQMIVNFHKKATVHPNNIAAYSFRNQFFPLQKPDDPYFENNYTTAKRYHITTLLKTLKEDLVFPSNRKSKVMGRPERILVWNTHRILAEYLIYRDDIVWYVHPDDALLYHYRRWRSSSSNKTIRDRRMHEFSTQLIDSVRAGTEMCSRPD